MALIYLNLLILYLFAVLNPNHFLPWPSFYNEFPVFIALAISLLIFWRRPVNGLPLIALLFLFLAFLPLCQYAFGLIYFLGDAVVASVYLISIAAMITLGGVMSREDGDGIVFFIAMSLLLAGLLSGGVVLFQWLEVSGYQLWVADAGYGGRPTGNLNQPNNQSTLLFWAFGSIVYLRQVNKVSDGAALLSAIYFALCSSLTESRSGWLLLVFFVVWSVWFSRKQAIKNTNALVFFFLIFYTSFSISVPALFNEALYLAGGRDFLSEASWTSRISMWWQLLVAAVHKIWLGYGWGQISFAQVFAAESLLPIREITFYAHNLFLDMILWNGFLIAFPLILLFLFLYFKSLLLASSPKAAFGLLLVGFLLVHSLVEFPYSYAYFLLPAALMVGVVSYELKAPLYFSKYSKVAAMFLSILFIPVLGVVGKDYITIEKAYREARFMARGIEGEYVFDDLKSVYILDHLQAYVLSLTVDVEQTELENLRTLSRRFPSSETSLRYIEALRKKGANDELLAYEVELHRRLYVANNK